MDDLRHFHNFLRDFDRQMRHANRHVILLVDNTASHNTGDLRLTNVRLHFLTPNTTAHIQPMDAGIIRAFKAHYKRQLTTHYIDCAEKNMPQYVDIRQAIHMTKIAWDIVTPTTIQNCFLHVQILPDTQFEEDDNLPLACLLPDEDDDDDFPLLELARHLKKLPETRSRTTLLSLTLVETETFHEDGSISHRYEHQFWSSRHEDPRDEDWYSAFSRAKDMMRDFLQSNTKTDQDDCCTISIVYIDAYFI